MQAIVQDRYGAPHVLELREIAIPEPGPGEVLVRVHAAGLDAAQWHVMTGMPLLVRLFFGLRRPRPNVRGTDLAGLVERVGDGVVDFAPGDAVLGVGRGSWAELACAPAAQLVHKPAQLSFAEAAALPESAMTARDALQAAAPLAAGMHLLVIGAGGGVGSFAVQLAKARSLEVTAVVSTSKLEAVRRLGADHVVDYTREDVTREDRRFDAILDLAGRRPVRRLRRVLTERGVLVLVGGEGGGSLSGGMQRQLGAVLRASFGRQRVRAPISTQRTRAQLEPLVALVETGQLRPLVGRTWPLADAAAAMADFARGHTLGKSVLLVR